MSVWWDIALQIPKVTTWKKLADVLKVPLLPSPRRLHLTIELRGDLFRMLANGPSNREERKMSLIDKRTFHGESKMITAESPKNQGACISPIRSQLPPFLAS